MVAPQAWSHSYEGQLLRRQHLSLPEDASSARVVVGIGHDRLAPPLVARILQRQQRGPDLLGGILELGRHRVLGEDKYRPLGVEVEGSVDPLWAGVPAGGHQVQRREPHVEDPPGLLSHAQDALGSLLVGGEVQMGKLGHGVTDGVVERPALGVVAPLDVGRRNGHLRAGDDRGEGLEAVGIDHQEVGA